MKLTSLSHLTDLTFERPLCTITRRSNPLIIKQIFMFSSLPLSSQVQNRSVAQWVFLRTGGKIYKTNPQITTARRHESGGIRHRK